MHTMDATGLQHRNSSHISFYLILLVFISNILHGRHVVSSAVFLSMRAHRSALSSSSTVYSQIQSLQELYIATDGAHWQWKNITIFGNIWNFSSSVVDPCGDNWQGVNCTCSSTCSIVGLQLRAYNLVGRLPPSIGNISTLQILDLGQNKLTSTIPAALSRATDLFALSLAYNQLTGTLPQELTALHRLNELYLTGNQLHGNLSILSQWPSMKSLFLRSNNFSGPLFDNWSQLTQLTLLDLAHNRLEGPFPSNIASWLSNSPELRFFDVGGNLLTGTVVDVLATATQLVHFNISRNFLQGSLPCSLQWKSLLYYSAGDNYFEGSVPSCVLNLTKLEFFNVANNYLHAPLPSFKQLSQLMVLSLTNNQFYGDLADILTPSLVDLWVDSNDIESTIPDDIAERSPNLTTIRFQNNQLLGTLPTQFKQLSRMNLALLYNNNFTGPIDTLYDPTVQTHMTHIDISGNRFNGPLPPAIFASASLITFVASTNCFSGTLPAAICNATRLQALLLDGLSTSSACLTEIFPHSPYFHTFKVKPNNLEGKIPDCIFDLPQLRTLHLAGNTFSGALPATAQLASSLVNLSLAHNTMGQSIPTVFQARSWLNYDVSYNRFRGYLSTDVPTPANNASYYADVNRLSGSIPNSLVPTLDISILAGNNFACRTLRTDLPENDPKRSTYDCGSDPVYRSMFLWVAIMTGAFCLYCALVLATRWYDTGATPSDIHRTLAKVDHWLFQMDLPAGMDTGGITSAKNLFRTIKGLFVTITTFSIVVLMPINAGLTMHYATQDQSYVWVTSSVFLSGWVPAFTLVIGFSLVLLIVWRFLSLRREEVERTMLESERNTAFYVSYTLLNVIVMGTADVAYVVGITTYGGAEALAIILGISIFKLGWNEGYLLSMFLTMKSYFYFYLCNDTYNIKRRLQEEERLKQQQHLAGPSLPPGQGRSRQQLSQSTPSNNRQLSTASSSSSVMASLASERIPPRERFRVSEFLAADDDDDEESKPPLGQPSDIAAYCRSDGDDDASVDLEAIRPVTVRRPMSSPGKATVKKRIKSITTALSPFHVPPTTHTTNDDTSANVSTNAIDDETNASADRLNRPSSLRVARSRAGYRNTSREDQDDEDIDDDNEDIRSSGFADSLATMYTVKDDLLLDDSQSRRRKLRSYNLKTDVILNSHDIAVITFNLIVNTVLLPGISVMFASPNCFYHIFYPSQTSPGSYVFSYCDSYDAHAWYQQFLTFSRETLPTTCPNAIDGSNTVSYVAPFTYNYTCASNIITVYTEAFIYQTLAISLIAPTSKYIFKLINSYLRTRGDTFCCFGDPQTALSYKEWFCCCYWACIAGVKSMVQQMVPRNLWTLQREPPHDDFVFFDQTFIPRIYSLFSILLVYGVIFPPLAVAVCVAALVITYSEELIISRLISKAKASKFTWVILRLSEECQGVEHRFTHPTLIWLMMLTVCPVYTYLVFDTAADPYGWQIGLIPAVFMFVVPTLLYIVRKSRRWGVCTTIAAVTRRRPVTQLRDLRTTPPGSGNGDDAATVVVSAMHTTYGGASGASQSQTPVSSTVHAETTAMDGQETTAWQRLMHDPLHFAQDVLGTAAVGIAGGGQGAQKTSVRGLEMLDLRPDIGDRRHLDAMLACEAAAGKAADGDDDGSRGSSASVDDGFGGGNGSGSNHNSPTQKLRKRCESSSSADSGSRESVISFRGSSMVVGRPSEIRESVSAPVSVAPSSATVLLGGGASSGGGGGNTGGNAAAGSNRISGAHAVVSGLVGGNATAALTEAALAALSSGTSASSSAAAVAVSEDGRHASVDVSSSQRTKRSNSFVAAVLAPLTRDRSSDLK